MIDDNEHDLSNEAWKNYFVDRRSNHNSWIRVKADSEFSAVSHLFGKDWIPVRDSAAIPDSYIIDNKRLTPVQILELAKFLSPEFGSGVRASRALAQGKVAIPFDCVSEFQRV